MPFAGQTTATSAYSGSPPLEVVEWDVEQDVTSWSASLPDTQLLGTGNVQQFSNEEILSEGGVCSMFWVGFAARINCVLALLYVLGLPTRDVRLVQESNESRGEAELEAWPPGTVTDTGKKPDFQLRRRDASTGSCRAGRLHSFIEIKEPSVLDKAGIQSLALFYNAEVQRSANEQGEFPAVRSVILQCFLYFCMYGATYFAISTYAVTWLCKVEVSELGDAGSEDKSYKMHISKGIPWNALQRGYTFTPAEALTWLFTTAGSLDPAPPSVRHPPRPRRSSGRSSVRGSADGVSSSSASSSAVSRGDGELGSGGQSTPADSGGDGSPSTGDDAPQAIEGPEMVLEGLDMDATEELGSGLWGTVYGGRLYGKPVAGKVCSEEVCRHEASLYEQLQVIQGRYIPELLYAGPTPKRTGHCLIMSRVFGRALKEGEGELLPAALEALRAMHACGVVHGDIRAPNFLVVSGNGNWRHVVVIDFHLSYLSSDPAEFLDEEQQLHELLGVPMPAPLPATSRAFAAVADVTSTALKEQQTEQVQGGSLSSRGMSGSVPCSSLHAAGAVVELEHGAHELWNGTDCLPRPLGRQPRSHPVASGQRWSGTGEAAHRRPAPAPRTTAGTAVRVRKPVSMTAGRGVLRCI